MKHGLSVIAAFFASAVLEASFGDTLSVAGVRPSLMLIAVYAFSITEPAGRGMLYGALGGALEDCLSGGYFGLFLSGYAMVGYLAGRAGKKWFNIGESANFAGIFALSLVNGFYTSAVLNALRGGEDMLGLTLRYGVPQALYNALAGAVTLWLFKSQLARRVPWLRSIRQHR